MIRTLTYRPFLQLILLLLPLCSYAQLRERTFVHYTNNEGLPYSATNDIIQDDDGFMWIATRMSVCRFDGYEFIESRVLDTEDNETHFTVRNHTM